MKDQVAAVKRALIGSLYKAAIDDAVERGFDADLIADAIVLCGGDAGLMRDRWNQWTAATDVVAGSGDPRVDRRAPFRLEEFVEYLRAAKALEPEPKEKQHVQPKRKRRKRGRRR